MAFFWHNNGFLVRIIFPSGQLPRKKVFSEPKILSWKGLCFDHGCLAAIFYSYSGGSSLPKREQLGILYLQKGCMLKMLGIHLSFVKTFESGNFAG